MHIINLKKILKQKKLQMMKRLDLKNNTKNYLLQYQIMIKKIKDEMQAFYIYFLFSPVFLFSLFSSSLIC